MATAELSWFPAYPDRFLSSERWNRMKDFQRGWYWQLLLLMTRSKPLGFLLLDEHLWTLAGAHTKQYWDNHAGLVLACFKEREFDGHRWIYSETLSKVLDEQIYKHDQRVERGRLGGQVKQRRSKSSLIYSFEFLTIWEKNIWKCVGKPKAYKSFQKSLEVIKQEKNCREDQAVEFLADAIEEFKSSPAGRDGGLFDDYTSPHPASWLNAQRFFDDRKNWQVTNGKGNNGSGSPESHNPAQGNGSRFAQEGCGSCQGTGWDCTSGKAVRCECFKRAKAHAANGTAK